MSKRTTIKDIAADCGVSLSTVSLVLNNSKRISEKTRARVLESVQRHNYQPNAQARALVSQSSRVISVTVPALEHVFADIYFGEIVSGIYDEASANGYKLLLDIARERFIESKEYLNLFQNRHADGMLFVGASTEDTYLIDFEKEEYPFMLVNHFFPGKSLDFYAVDYADCARLAAEHFLKLGHRSIGLIIGDNTHTGITFRDTFFQQLAEAGIPEADRPWVRGKWDEQSGYVGAEKLLEKNPGLTAIMGGNDRMAIGAMRHLNLLNKRIPEEVSVLGMDDIPASKYVTPGLSSISVDLYRIGLNSCNHILRMIRGEERTCREFVQGNLVERESTGPAPV